MEFRHLANRVPEAAEHAVDERPHWILAYDGGCGACRSIAARVSDIAEGKLSVRSLFDPEIEAWRRQALGQTPPWTPTLLKVERGKVSAWTHRSMSQRMVSLLGPRKAWDVGQLLAPRAASGLGRRGFIGRLSGAAAVAAFLVANRPLARTAGAHSEVGRESLAGPELDYLAEQAADTPGMDSLRSVAGAATAAERSYNLAQPGQRQARLLGFREAGQNGQDVHLLIEEYGDGDPTGNLVVFQTGDGPDVAAALINDADGPAIYVVDEGGQAVRSDEGTAQLRTWRPVAAPENGDRINVPADTHAGAFKFGVLANHDRWGCIFNSARCAAALAGCLYCKCPGRPPCTTAPAPCYAATQSCR